MAKLIVLGSSSAVPDFEHENTHLAILGEERVVLVDCVGNPIVRLRQAGWQFAAPAPDSRWVISAPYCAVQYDPS